VRHHAVTPETLVDVQPAPGLPQLEGVVAELEAN